jgi:DNA-binding response OmpR family regulator
MTGSSHRILIVEDDPDVAAGLIDLLQACGYDPTHVNDGALAVPAARAAAYDLIILDVQLPHRSGLEICRGLRSDPTLSRIPVIFLSAYGDDLHRVAGLETGADDYVVKPFNAREVVLRIESVLRRRSGPPAQHPLRVGGIVLDEGTRAVSVAGAAIDVTVREFELLAALIRAKGKALSRDFLLLEVWHYPTADVRTRTIDAHVLQLRKKLGAEAWRVKTLDRFGYRLDCSDAQDSTTD